ncbi:hypothetical protein Patl1_23131 [Pistacia atlantica]|uniref:Uncharacterized protein n=1 Tax=Pistacia atlantica TaxID=434234 RepID=A0ACC0ZV64_9ROSI|nr:hypothetical protein Patl1_23131 [Pistacia atlantica]
MTDISSLPGRQLITIFSAAGYRGGNNSGAVLNVGHDLVCTFQILEPSGSGSTATNMPTKFREEQGGLPLVNYQSLDDGNSQEIEELKDEVGELAVKVDDLSTRLELLEWERTRRYYYD